ILIGRGLILRIKRNEFRIQFSGCNLEIALDIPNHFVDLKNNLRNFAKRVHLYGEIPKWL
ncbi:hypothetical protein, partial [Paenibacillus peoriae]|uniref:hypothetical protein n=1 Tax=Paenibacillus peoriae TaxID=59893 RepID=UPI001C4D68E7